MCCRHEEVVARAELHVDEGGVRRSPAAARRSAPGPWRSASTAVRRSAPRRGCRCGTTRLRKPLREGHETEPMRRHVAPHLLIERADEGCSRELAPAAHGEARDSCSRPARRLGRPLEVPLADTLAADAELRRDRREADAGPCQALQQPRMGVAARSDHRKPRSDDRAPPGSDPIVAIEASGETWAMVVVGNGYGVMVRTKQRGPGRWCVPGPSDGHECRERI